MSCSSIMFSLFLLSPCGHGGGNDGDEAVIAAVSNPRRPAADVAKDAGRKPAEVLSFLEIKPGMTVLDLFSGGGYYTEILDTLVGAEGKVIAHTNDAYIAYNGDEFTQRYADGRLVRVETVVAEADDLKFEDNSLDVALLALTWHDFFYADPENGWAEIDEDRLTDKLCAAMKPGAVLGLIDHAANAGGDTATVARDLHRIDPQQVRDTFKGTCFRLEAEADFLRNSEDDHTLPMYDQAVRGKTDRFVFRIVRI